MKVETWIRTGQEPMNALVERYQGAAEVKISNRFGFFEAKDEVMRRFGRSWEITDELSAENFRVQMNHEFVLQEKRTRRLRN